MPNAKAKDAIALLRADHREAQKMFDEFEAKHARMSASAKTALVGRICAALKAHTTIEEEIFYPAVRAALPKIADLLDEADVEHASAKDLIAQLEAAKPADDKYDAMVTVLGEYIKHHVKEEQNEMFPEAQKSRKLDMAELGAQLQARKEELQGVHEDA